MSHDTLATLLWTLLGISVVLSVMGIVARSGWMLAVAAAIAFGFGLLAIFSIGIFIIALALAQAGLAWHFSRTTTPSIER